MFLNILLANLRQVCYIFNGNNKDFFLYPQA